MSLLAACQAVLDIAVGDRRSVDLDAGVDRDSGSAGAATSASGGNPDVSNGGQAGVGGGSAGQTAHGGSGTISRPNPELVRSRVPLVSDPKLATSKLGSIAVWLEFGDYDLDIKSSFAPLGGSFAEPVRVDAGKRAAESVDVVMDNDGNAFVSWLQDSLGVPSIWANRRSASGVWEGPTLLETTSNEANAPVIAIGASGHVAVAWQQEDANTESIWVARYENGAWLAPEVAEDHVRSTNAPKIAVAPNGDVFVVWVEGQGLYANRRANGVWRTPQPIDSHELTLVSIDSDIAAGGQGSAFAFWLLNGTRLRGSQFLPHVATAWSPAEIYLQGDNCLGLPRAKMDRVGNLLLLAACGPQSSAPSRLSARLYRADLGIGSWQQTEFIDAEPRSNSEGATSFTFAMNSNGLAQAIWVSDDPELGMFTNRFDGTAWQQPKKVANLAASIGPQMSVAMDAEGNSVALWLQSHGETNDIIAAWLE